MSATRGQTATRQLHRAYFKPPARASAPSRIRTFAQTSFRSWERQRVLTGSRAHASTPAAFQTSHGRLQALGKSRGSGWYSDRIADEGVLQSAFPRKTFIALLVLGGAAYWFLDVRFGRDWMDDVRPVGPGDQPLHFYESKDVLDHIVEAHMPDPLNVEEVGQVIDAYSEQFEKMIGGFAMTDAEAKEVNMPVTHGAQAKGNEACEDRLALGTSPGVGAEPWNFWGVYDGHAGYQTSTLLQMTLIPNVSYRLSNLLTSSSAQQVARSIMDTFTRLDDQMMNTAKRGVQWYPALSPIAINAIAPALSGSCALLSCYDPKTSKLHVACTGDSRAVLGRWDPAEGKYVAQALSTDQTGFNKEEVDRITEAHPEEEGIIDPRSGRLLGMAVTRAFGDHRWKWDDDTILQAQYKYFGSPPRPKSKTPPYMTAEPVVTETNIQKGEKPDFMIMASDGLWDNISSEHAVELINDWLEARAKGNGSVKDAPFYTPPPPFASLPPRLDPGVEFEYDPEKPEENKFPSWRATPEYFAIEDDNAAVCLIRNAFGGRRRALFGGLFSLPGNVARMAMDDTTVLVVFFGGLGDDKYVKGKKEVKGQMVGGDAGKERKWWKPW